MSRENESSRRMLTHAPPSRSLSASTVYAVFLLALSDLRCAATGNVSLQSLLRLKSSQSVAHVRVPRPGKPALGKGIRQAGQGACVGHMHIRERGPGGLPLNLHPSRKRNLPECLEKY